jgi:hypothetical protein
LKFSYILLSPLFLVAQIFPSLASLSTGQGVPCTYDATWEVNTQWLVVEPTNTLSSGVYYYIVKKSNNEIKTGWVYLATE